MYSATADAQEVYFRVDNGLVTTSEPVAPVASSDRLYLVYASNMPPFRPVYEALSRMRFYNLDPKQMRDLQTPSAEELLVSDGRNSASVLDKMVEQEPDTRQRIQEYLAVIVPGVQDVFPQTYGPKETLLFSQKLSDTEQPLYFPASSMSDGTLRALGILIALFQARDSKEAAIPLVGIEEPETALHPFAVAVLLDALEEGSITRQVIVISHSADLLDNKRIDPDALLAVVAKDGKTEIGPIDAASRSILCDHLFTAGELLRMNQFTPDTSALQQAGLVQHGFITAKE